MIIAETDEERKRESERGGEEGRKRKREAYDSLRKRE